MKITPNMERIGFQPELAQAARQFHGALKAVILSPEIAICFAGNTDAANEAISEIYSNRVNIYETQAILDHFKSKHDEFRQNGTLEPPDFIIASLRGAPALHRIRNGTLQPHQGETWIGLPDAFNQYGRYLSGVEDYKAIEDGYRQFEIKKMPDDITPEAAEQCKATSFAFEKVLRNPAFPGVDGIRVELNSTPNGFQYSERVSVTGRADLPPPTMNPTGIYFGTETEGSFSYHLIGPNAGILGLYYYTGSFGFVFMPTISPQPIRIQDITKVQFDQQFEGYLDRVWQQGLEMTRHLFPNG